MTIKFSFKTQLCAAVHTLNKLFGNHGDSGFNVPSKIHLNMLLTEMGKASDNQNNKKLFFIVIEKDGVEQDAVMWEDEASRATD